MISGSVPSQLGQMTGLETIMFYFNDLTAGLETLFCDSDTVEVFLADCAGSSPQIVCG